MSMEKPGYITWTSEEDKPAQIAKAGEAYATAHLYTTKSSSVVRDGLTRRDYNFYRPESSISEIDRDAIIACMNAYQKFPLVRSIIDLMADFACKGIDVIHPRKNIQLFGQKWFAKVNGIERTERMLNMIYRAGNLFVKRSVAKIPQKSLKAFDYAKSADMKIVKFDGLKQDEIPIGYTILDPRLVELVGGDLSPFIGQQSIQYAVRIPLEMQRKYEEYKNSDNVVPIPEMQTSIYKSGSQEGKIVLIPKEKMVAIYYKKDDFQLWAVPIIYPLLEHLELYDKLMLADKAALDGAISNIRLWTLGSLEYKIYPNEAMMNRLNEVLENAQGGNVLDLVWGPELKLTETRSEAYKFLGKEKYTPVLQAIFQGLGIPPSLSGMGDDTGYTNNLMNLKVLIERLEYGRNLIKNFWLGELEILRQRFGFREPFGLAFEESSLVDEATILRLIVDLADRDIVSHEFVQERFGAVPEVEEYRLRRQMKKQKSGKAPLKASPYHTDSQQKNMLERTFVNQGMVTPSQVGFNYPMPKPEEVDNQPNNNDDLGVEDNDDYTNIQKTGKSRGRPSGSKDKGKRKIKNLQGSSKAELSNAIIWAGKAHSQIDEIIKPAFLKAKSKENLRQLTSNEFVEYEKFKFAVLCSFDINEDVTKEKIINKIGKDIDINTDIMSTYQKSVALYINKYGQEPTAEISRQLQSAVYASYMINKNQENENGDD